MPPLSAIMVIRAAQLIPATLTSKESLPGGHCFGKFYVHSTSTFVSPLSYNGTTPVQCTSICTQPCNCMLYPLTPELFVTDTHRRRHVKQHTDSGQTPHPAINAPRKHATRFIAARGEPMYRQHRYLHHSPHGSRAAAEALHPPATPCQCQRARERSRHPERDSTTP